MAPACFEGQRIYNGKIYKLKEHTAHGCSFRRNPGHEDSIHQDQINQAASTAAAPPNIKDGYLRPWAFRGSEMMAGSRRRAPSCRPSLLPWPSLFQPGGKRSRITAWIFALEAASAERAVQPGCRSLHDLAPISKHEAEAGLCDALMYLQLVDLAVIDALALEHAGAIMQPVSQHMGLGVLPGTNLPSYQSEPSRWSKGITSAIVIFLESRPRKPTTGRACPP